MFAPFFVRGWMVVGLLLLPCFASAQSHAKHKPRAALPAPMPVHAAGDVGELPPAALAALQRAKVPADALHVMLWEAGSTAAPRLSHQAQTPVNPASLMKLVTTSAALDSLGAAFNSPTPVSQVWVVLDARMDQVYTAAYVYQDGVWQEAQAPQLQSPQDATPPAEWGANFVCAGNAWQVYAGRWPDQLPEEKILLGPTAAALTRLAVQAWQQGLAVAPELALPLYIRDKVAQTTAEREIAKQVAA